MDDKDALLLRTYLDRLEKTCASAVGAEQAKEIRAKVGKTMMDLVSSYEALQAAHAAAMARAVAAETRAAIAERRLAEEREWHISREN